MSTINRITGTNSGIDVDSVVKASLTNEQNKIDKAYKQQKIYEYQQEQLKKIMSDCSDFYDKYLNRLSSTSLLSDSSYETVTFTSSDGAVTAKGYAGAIVTDYKVSVSQLASKASETLKISDFNEVLNSGKGVLSIKMGTNSYADVDIVVKDGEVDMSATAKALTKELNKNGIGVTAKYSSISKGIILESNSMGEDVTFGVAIKKDTDADTIKKDTADNKHDIFNYKYHTGTNAKGTIIRDGNIYQVDTNSNVNTVDNVQFTFNEVKSAPEGTSTTNISDLQYSDSDLFNNTVIVNGGEVTLEAADRGIQTIVKKGVEVTTINLDEVTLKRIHTADGDEDSEKTKVVGDLIHLTEDDVKNYDYITQSSGGHGEKIITDNNTGKKTTISSDGKIVTEYKYTYKQGDGTTAIGTVTTTTTAPDSEGKTNTTTEYSGSELAHLKSTDDSISKVIIEKGDGSKRTTKVKGVDENGKNQYITTTIKTTSDGDSTEKQTVENYLGEKTSTTATHSSTELSGKTDITNLKDTLVKFVNDYNTLIGSINDKLWETRDRDYEPLTEDQQSEMTEKQIEAWNKKAEAGLLRSDSDLERIQSSMKKAMSTLMNSTGLSLEQMGIEPVDNYTTKNGTFTINESKLTSALENNSEAVKDLFTRAASGDDKGGILTQLQSTFKSEIKSSTSILAKRAGLEGTATESSNTLSDYITKQKALIKELKSKYTDRETALYNKYSALEVALEKLNSQTNSLYSMLGIN